jgi:hypothetical protein
MVDLLLCALSTIFILDGATDKWHGGLVSNRRYPLSLRKTRKNPDLLANLKDGVKRWSLD